METTRRGFFGLVAGALASVPVLGRLVPPAPEPEKVLVATHPGHYMLAEVAMPIEVGDVLTCGANGTLRRVESKDELWAAIAVHRSTGGLTAVRLP